MKNLISMIQQQVLQLLEKEAPKLEGIETREVCGMVLQHNPKRAVSTGAKVDPASIASRPCFLCKDNRPAEQGSVVWNDDFEILVNPFPILEGHLTIPLRRHEPQRILPYLDDMASLAKDLPQFIVFYNGAKCGASAPDHMHFQAVYAGQTPMERGKRTPSQKRMKKINDIQELKDIIKIWGKDYEQKINLFCKYNEADDNFTFYLFERRKHRPCIYDMGVMVSPGALDMAGILVLPQRNIFQGITHGIVSRIFDEV